MMQLAKDYLENKDSHHFKEVEVIEFLASGTVAFITFRHAGSAFRDTTVIELWEVLAYVNFKP